MRRFACLLALAAAALPALPAAALDEVLYAGLLRQHTREVNDLARVRVDYAAIARSADWKKLVASLAATDTATLRSRDEKLAFWVNAYNILAIDLVAKNYPLESIRDIGSFFSPVWKHEAGRIGGKPYSLDQIEHEIVRPMGDPRTHSAVICASTSCPALRREPFSAARLDAQLDDAMRTWMADPGKGLKLDRADDTVHLSKIYDWFEEDFAAQGGAVKFAARYAPDDTKAWLKANATRADVEYFDYDWRVNALR
ncbi:MAG: DUF547 domain-containing protein [Proteobacteria bacterium]|nr:DUF547 domain-containing protein [Pseudomonadota bacterium]